VAFDYHSSPEALMKAIAIAAAFVAALAVAGCNWKAAEPGKNVPECKSGDACDHTKG
jgi:hypothetical protein